MSPFPTRRPDLQQQDAAVAEMNRQAAEQDFIQQQQQEQRRMQEEQARNAARAQKAALANAKRQGVKIAPDATGAETIQRHPDGQPVYEAGFVGQPQISDQGGSVAYRDARGQRYDVPFDAIRSEPDPTGETFYSFDVTAPDGTKQTMRQPAGTKPLFRVDPGTGSRIVDVTDPATGSVQPRVVGVDPLVANKAAIEKRKNAAQLAQNERSGAAEELRLQLAQKDTLMQPVRQKLREAQEAADKLAKEKSTYEQTADGFYAVTSLGDGVEPMRRKVDSPAEIAKADAWVKNRAATEKALADAKAAHDPAAAEIQAMKERRAALAIETLKEDNRAQAEIQRMQEAAEKGTDVTQADWQTRVQSLANDERMRKLNTIADLEAAGDPLAPDVQRAAMPDAAASINRMMSGMLNNGRDLLNAGMRGKQPTLLDAIQSDLATNNPAKPGNYKDAQAIAMKSLGIADPARVEIEQREVAGLPFAMLKVDGEDYASLDLENNRLTLIQTQGSLRDNGAEIIANASRDGVPVFMVANGQPYNAAELRDLIQDGIEASQSAKTNEEAAANLESIGLGPSGIREKVMAGKLSVQDGKMLNEKLHGIKQVNASTPAVKAEFGKWMAETPVMAAKYQNGTREQKAEVVHHFMDRWYNQYRLGVMRDNTSAEQIRDTLLAATDERGDIAKAAAFTGGALKNGLASLAGIGYWLLRAPDRGIRLIGGTDDQETNLVWNQSRDLVQRLSGEQAPWNKDSSPMAATLGEVHNWASNADSVDDMPDELAEKLAEQAFTNFHGFSEQSAADVDTNRDTFNVKRNPQLRKMLQRYLDSANGADFNGLFGMLKMNARERDTAIEVQKYIERPRTATAADAVARAELIGLKLDTGKATAALNLAAKLENAQDQKQHDAILKQVAEVLGVEKPEHAALALSEIARMETTDPDSFAGSFRGASVADIGELATEVVTDAALAALSATVVGAPEGVALKGAQIAAKQGIRASLRSGVSRLATHALDSVTDRIPALATIRQTIGRGRAAIGAEVRKAGEEFAALGIKKPTFGGPPLTTAQKASNLAVGTGKAIAAGAPMETAEEGLTAFLSNDPSAQNITDSMLQGAIGVGGIVPVFTGVRALQNAYTMRGRGREWEAKKREYIDKVNAEMSKIPGFKPLTVADFDAWQGLQDNPAHTQARAAYQSALATFEQELALHQDAAAGKATLPLTPELLAARVQLDTAANDLQEATSSAFMAMDELRGIPEAERPLYTGAAKAATGARDFTEAEAKALMAQGGNNAVTFQQAQVMPADVAGPPAQRTVGAPAVSNVAPGVYRLPAGVRVDVPPALLDSLVQKAPTMVDLLRQPANQTPAVQAVVAKVDAKKQATPKQPKGKKTKQTAPNVQNQTPPVQPQQSGGQNMPQQGNVPLVSQQPPAQAPTQGAAAGVVSPDEVAAAETNESLYTRTKVGPERDKAVAERRASAERLAKTIKKGDKIILADGEELVAERDAIQKTGEVQFVGYGTPVKAADYLMTDKATLPTGEKVELPAGKIVRATPTVQTGKGAVAQAAVPKPTLETPINNAPDALPQDLNSKIEALTKGGSVSFTKEEKDTVNAAWGEASPFNMPEAFKKGLNTEGKPAFDTDKGKAVSLPMRERFDDDTPVAKEEVLFIVEAIAEAEMQRRNTLAKRRLVVIGGHVANDGGAAYFWENDTVEINPQRLARMAWAEMLNAGKTPTRRLVAAQVRGVITHEIFHAAQFEAARRAYSKIKGDKPAFEEWVKGYYEAIWNSLDPEQQQATIAAYGTILANAPEWHRGAEASRMLLETGTMERMSEAIIRHLENVLAVLKRWYDDVVTGKADNAIVADELQRVQAVLDAWNSGGTVKPDAKKKPAKAKAQKPEAPKTPKSSTQLTLSPADAKPILDFGATIPKDELFDSIDPEWSDGALETEPHVTVLYGLTKHEAAPVAKVIKDHGPITITLGKLSIFENDQYDVLKVDVESPELRALNAKLSKLPHESSFPDYKPHMTIAYLKKGEGKKYVGDARFEGQTITFNTMTFSPPSELRGKLGKPELPLTPSQAIPPATTQTNANEKDQAKGQGQRQEVLTPANPETAPRESELSNPDMGSAGAVDGFILGDGVMWRGAPYVVVSTEQAPDLIQIESTEGSSYPVRPGELQRYDAPQEVQQQAFLRAAQQHNESFNRLFHKGGKPKKGTTQAQVDKHNQRGRLLQEWQNKIAPAIWRGTATNGTPAAILYRTPAGEYVVQIGKDQTIMPAANTARMSGLTKNQLEALPDNPATPKVKTRPDLDNPAVQEGDWIMDANGSAGPVIGFDNGTPIMGMEGANPGDVEPQTAQGGWKLAPQSEITPVQEPVSQPAKISPEAKSAVNEAEQKAADAMRANLAGLFSAPAPQWQDADIPEDRVAGIMQTTKLVFEAGIRTPEAFAAFMERTFPGGKSRPYVSGIWQIMGGMRRELRTATIPDWRSIYAEIDRPITQPTPNESLAAQVPEEGRLSIYPLRDRWLVQQGDTRGFGDHIYNTEQEAIQASIQQQNMEAENRRFQAEQERRQQEQTAEDARVAANLTTYLDGLALNAMQRGKLKSSLETDVARQSSAKNKTYSGPRFLVAEEMVADGYRPQTEQVPAIKEPTRTQWNRMDNRQQAEFERRRKEAGTKTEYTLALVDGSAFVVTKAEHDYANWLSSRPPSVEGVTGPSSEQGAAPAASPTSFPVSVARALMAMPYHSRTFPMGDRNAELRQQVLEVITGERPPKSKAGANAVREALRRFFNVSEDDTTAAIDENIQKALQAVIDAAEPSTPYTPAQQEADRVRRIESEQRVIEASAKAEVPERGDTVTWTDGAGKEAVSMIDQITNNADGTPVAWVEWFGVKSIPLDQLTLKTKSSQRLNRERREAEAAAKAGIPTKEVTTPEPVKEKKPADNKALKEMKRFLLEKLDDAIAEAPDFDSGDNISAQMTALESHREFLRQILRNAEAYTPVGIAKIKDRLGALIQLPEKAGFAEYDKALGQLINQEAARIRALRPKVIIEIPGDGTFTLLNDKKTLKEFAKIAKGFPTTTPSATYPKPTAIRPSGIPALNKAKLSKMDMVKVAGTFASTDETRMNIMQVVDVGDTLVATNGKYLFMAPFEGQGTAEDPMLYTAKGGQIGPQSKHEEDFGKYPDWKVVVPKDAQVLHTGIDTGRLWQILKQASAVFRDVNFQVKNGSGTFDDAVPYVDLFLNPDGSVAVVGEVENGKVGRKDNVDRYEHNLQEGAQSIGRFDASLFMDILAAMRALGQEKVSFRSEADMSQGAFVVSSPVADVILMRVRTQAATNAANVEAAQAAMTPAEETAAAPVEWPTESRNLTLADTARAAEMTDEEIEAAATPVLEALRELEAPSGVDQAGIAKRGGSVYDEALEGKFSIKELAAAHVWLRRHNAYSVLMDSMEYAIARDSSNDAPAAPKASGLRTQADTIHAGRSPAELLALAAPYEQQGPDYNRNIAESAARLRQSVERGDKFVQLNADELAVRLEKWAPEANNSGGNYANGLPKPPRAALKEAKRLGVVIESYLHGIYDPTPAFKVFATSQPDRIEHTVGTTANELIGAIRIVAEAAGHAEETANGLSAKDPSDYRESQRVKLQQEIDDRLNKPKVADPNTPLFDEDYKGPRFTYGLRNRPLSTGAQPKGWIIGSNRANSNYLHGTVDYPRELTPDELYSYELEPVTRANEDASQGVLQVDMRRFSSDLNDTGVAYVNGDRYAIKQANDGTYYVERTRNGQREDLATGFADIAAANRGALEVVTGVVPVSNDTKTVQATAVSTPTIEDRLQEIADQATGAGFTETKLATVSPAFRVRTTRTGERIIEQFEGAAKGWTRQTTLSGEEMDDAWVNRWVQSRGGYLMPAQIDKPAAEVVTTPPAEEQPAPQVPRDRAEAIVRNLTGKEQAGKLNPKERAALEEARARLEQDNNGFDPGGNVPRQPARPRNGPPTTHIMPDGYELTAPGMHMLASAPVRAFHGTPHKVDKFRLANIGTGEGAQAYGWGLYFAAARAIAEYYQKALTDNTLYFNGKPLLKNGVMIGSLGDAELDDWFYHGSESYDPEESAQSAESDGRPDIAAKIRALIPNITKGEPGNLYTVELLPDADEFLDWDKPLSEQSEKVRDALAFYANNGTGRSTAFITKAIGDDLKASDFYLGLSQALQSHQAASESLARKIPGIRYLDQGSRGAGDGTRNYVIFDESLVRILEENGKPISEAPLASAPVRSVTPAQDAEYMAAVETGDMEKAQRMVDEAARAQPIRVIESYDLATSEELVASARAGQPESKNEGVRRPEGLRESVSLIELPLSLFKKDYLEFLAESTRPERVGKYELLQIQTPIYALLSNRGTFTISDGGHRLMAAIKRGDETIRAYFPTAKLSNLALSQGGGVYQGLPLSQSIKSTESFSINPVTRDDAGNVIPQSDSILYSAPAPKKPNRATQAMRDIIEALPPPHREVLRDLLVNGVTPEDAATKHKLSETAVGNILRRGEAHIRLMLDRAPTKPTVQVQDGIVKATDGRPDRALAGNAVIAAATQRAPRPEEVTHAEMQELARRLFDVAPVDAETLVRRYLDSNGTDMRDADLSPEVQSIMREAHARNAAPMLMQAAGQLYTIRKTTDGTGNSHDLVRLAWSWFDTGTATGRALGMRRDPFDTPEERAAYYLQNMLLTPPESIHNELRRNPANRDRILAAWAKRADQIKGELLAHGIDLDATFADHAEEQKLVEETIPEPVKPALARAPKKTRQLVKAIMQGMTPAEAIRAAGLTAKAAFRAYQEFRASLNQAGTEAAQAMRDQLLRSAPVQGADFAANLGLPDLTEAEWLEAVQNNKPLRKTPETEKLKQHREKAKKAGTIDLKNSNATRKAKRAIQERKSTTFDKWSEFWRASILSGPQTHVVNIVSGLTYGTYEASFKKLAAGAQADIARMFGAKPDAASLADIPAMIAAVLPSIREAFTNSIASWKSETSVFDQYAMQLKDDNGELFKEGYSPALKGTLGKVMRGISFRLMGAADEFVKSFFTRIEVAAQARQIARNEGKTGHELAKAIQELMEPGSLAWERALAQAKRITFQNEEIRTADGPLKLESPLAAGDRTIDAIDGLAQLISRTKKGDFGKPLKGLAHFTFPFVDTPTNIFKAGVTMSPVGGLLALVDMIRAYNRYRKGNAEEAAKIYNAARALDDLTNQIVAWGFILGLSHLVKPGDDEDETPFITGTIPWRSTSPGERELAYRTAPPQSIRIGDRWISYRRLDPFASALAFTVDAIKEFQSGKPIDEVGTKIGLGIMRNMQDKTFLQGISDVVNAVQDPERFGTKWATNIATGFIPNLIRQPIRTADDVFRETDLPNDLGFWDALGRRMGYGIYPQGAMPAITVWGEPARKDTGTGGPNTDWMLRLLSPADLRAANVDMLDVALLRYNATHQDGDPRALFGVTAPSRELQRTIGGQVIKISLDDAEYEDFITKAGKAARQAIGNTYEGRDLTEQDVDRIKDILSRAHETFRNAAFVQAVQKRGGLNALANTSK